MIKKMICPVSRCWMLICSLWIGSAGAASAQSLKELYGLLKEQNPQIKAHRQVAMAAQEKAKQAGKLDDPVIGAGYFILPVETRLGPQHVRLSVQQTLPWFGVNKAEKQEAYDHEHVKTQQVTMTTLQLQWELTQAYYQLFHLEKDETLLAKHVALYEAYEKLAVEKYSNGSVKLAEVLAIRLRLEEKNTEKKNNKARQKRWLAIINEQLFRKPDTPILFPDSLMLMNEFENPLDTAFASHPTMRWLGAQAKEAESRVAVMQMKNKPQINIGLDYIAIGPREDAALLKNGQDVLMPRVGLTVPLFNREKYRSMAQESQWLKEALQSEIATQRQALRGQQAQANAKMQEVANDLKMYTRQLATIEQLVELRLTDFSNGSAPMEELLDTEALRLDYQRKRLQAETELLTAKAWLSWLKGSFSEE